MIPDLALQHVVVTGLRTLKRSPKRIDQLFANLPVEARAQVRDFIVNTPIHLTHVGGRLKSQESGPAECSRGSAGSWTGTAGMN